MTGGASGIGLAMVRHFAAEGHRITILNVNAQAGPSVAAQVAADFSRACVDFAQCDVSSWDEQAAAFQRVFHQGGDNLDMVMANAGVLEQGETTLVELGKEGEPEPPRLESVETNFLGVIYCEPTTRSTLAEPC